MAYQISVESEEGLEWELEEDGEQPEPGQLRHLHTPVLAPGLSQHCIIQY